MFIQQDKVSESKKEHIQALHDIQIIHHVLWLSCQVGVSNPREHQMHWVTFAMSIELIVPADRSVAMEINGIKNLCVEVWDSSLALFALLSTYPSHSKILEFYKGLAWEEDMRLLQYSKLNLCSVVECSIND